MFKECCFLLGEGHSIIIAIPAMLPEADTYTVVITSDSIRFKADFDSVAEMSYPGGEVYRRLAQSIQVGLIEYEADSTRLMPSAVTNVAYIEVRSVM